jgi:hypothetical protein
MVFDFIVFELIKTLKYQAMKSHFISLFDKAHLRKTMILLVICAAFLAVSLIVGTSDNVPMIVMMSAGIVILYFTALYPWEKATYFAILAAICMIILAVDFIFPFFTEGIAMTAGLICFAGVIAGLIGIFTRLKGWNRFPYASALLSFVALVVLITSITRALGILYPGKQWILVGLQAVFIITFFVIALINRQGGGFTRIILIISGILLLLVGAWAFYASSWQFVENGKGFTGIMLRFYGILEFLTAAAVFYACK